MVLVAGVRVENGPAACAGVACFSRAATVCLRVAAASALASAAAWRAILLGR